MQIVGVTTQQEIYIVSRKHKFRMNEILVVEDAALRFPKVEVVETMSYNRLIPMGLDKSLVDAEVLQTLQQIGYDIDADAICLAKARLYEEAEHPVQTGCIVRFPEFSEVRDLLVKVTPAEGMVVGEIRSTETLSPTLPAELADQVQVLERGNLRSQDGVPFIFDVYSMQQYPHIGVFGGSGSGKSFGLRVMLEELLKLRIPSVIFDPHFEMDFEQDVEGMKYNFPLRQQVYPVQIGQEVGISFPDLSVRDVVDLLSAAGGHLTESMVNVVQMLHKRKDTSTSFGDRLNNLVQALEEKRELEKQINSGSLTELELMRAKDLLKLLQEHGSLPLSSVKGVQWRLARLVHAGLFQHDISPVVRALKERKLIVVQGSIWILQIFATYLIGALYRWRRDYRDAQMNGRPAAFFPPFVVITDEAHNFAPKAFEAPTKSVLKEIAQEGRKYGVFLILATQRPALLDETITAQLNTKFVFRTVRGTDIALLREETDLTPEEGKRLPYLASGDAFVSSAVFGRTIYIRVRAAYTSSPHMLNPFAELDAQEAAIEEKFINTVQDLFPILDTNLLSVANHLSQQAGTEWDVEQVKEFLNKLAGKGLVERTQTAFAVKYEQPCVKC
ncbi:MAG: hypothetical protein RLZ12_812 [Bacillota bacterium]